MANTVSFSIFNKVRCYFVEMVVEFFEGIFVDLGGVVDSVYFYKLFSKGREAPFRLVSEFPSVMLRF